ncbi:M16 family metallopeptidase [Micromonospora sp. CA-263727]|uniref:M16 family metallopeptidase n=1 Tax=Micromonospora sp. CA-263727 TaxID=3239967 RepID=UPI003D94AF79
MERTEIDGVPVLWAQGPAPLSATLIFGCGGQDEIFRTIGVTHLVEHLAMSGLPRVHHDRNASVDLHTTQFTATGRPEQIVTFLDAVCRALADLPLDRIQKEAGVLAAEGGAYTDPTVAALLTRRFGVHGPGLAPWTGPGFDRISAEDVRAHAARFFVAGNAVLVLTGPPPEGLRLPLPAGPRAEHPTATPLPAQSGPAWSEHLVPAVGAAVLGRRGAAWVLGMSVLAERLERIARHHHGLSYEVSGETVPGDGDTALYAITVDAREGQEAEVARLLWAELNRMAEQGPTEEELAEEREAVREAYQDPRFLELELLETATRELFGRPYLSPDDRLARCDAITSDEVREIFRAALPTTQLVVPCGVTVDLPGVAEHACVDGRQLPPGRLFQPPALAKVFSREARVLRLVLTDDGLALRDPDGDVHRIRFAEVVGVEEDGAERTVFGAHGCIINVDPELFKGAEAAVRAVDAAVPAQLRYHRSALVGRD